MAIRNTRAILMPYLMLFGGAVLLYALLTPPFQMPDEPAHLAYCLSVSQTRLMSPEYIEQDILKALHQYRFWELVQERPPHPIPHRFYDAPLLRSKPTQLSKPKLYYSLCGFLLKMFQVSDPVSALYILRLFSVVISIFTATLFYVTIRLVFIDERMQYAALSTLAVPQILFMAGANNPAVLSWLTATGMILGSVMLIRKHHTPIGYLLISSGFILALFSHRAALTVLPGIILAIILARFDRQSASHRSATILWSSFLLGAFSVLTFMIAANSYPMFVRHLTLRVSQIVFQVIDVPAADGLDWNWLKSFMLHFHHSLWLSFGWLKFHASSPLYWLFALCYIPLIIGFFTFSAGTCRLNLPSRRILAVMVLIILTTVWAGIATYGIRHEFSQGRYLFPAWPAFAIIGITGIFKMIPARYTLHVSFILVILSWSIAGYAIWKILVPAFYF